MLKEINHSELNENMFNVIGRNWMLLTAGNEEKLNTMTISWGGTGILWNKPVAFLFVRPQRYTKEFIDNGKYFTMSGYSDEMRPAMKFCGRNSGRDIDKIKETGLIPVFEEKAPYFKQAKLVLVCRKLYAQELSENCIIDDNLLEYYSSNDYHTMYVAEIVKVLVDE